MAISSTLTTSFKKELLQGVHNFLALVATLLN